MNNIFNELTFKGLFDDSLCEAVLCDDEKCDSGHKKMNLRARKDQILVDQ
jgi:hypothetical protein